MIGTIPRNARRFRAVSTVHLARNLQRVRFVGQLHHDVGHAVSLIRLRPRSRGYGTPQVSSAAAVASSANGCWTWAKAECCRFWKKIIGPTAGIFKKISGWAWRAWGWSGAVSQPDGTILFWGATRGPVPRVRWSAVVGSMPVGERRRRVLDAGARSARSRPSRWNAKPQLVP